MYNLWGLAQLLKQHPNPVFAPHLEQRDKIIHAFLILEHQVKETYTHPEKMDNEVYFVYDLMMSNLGFVASM